MKKKIKLIIEVSEKYYEACKDAVEDGFSSQLDENIANGIPVADEQKHIESDRWIPVTERLPNDRDWYLGVFKEPDTGWINPIPFICDYVGEITKGTTNEGWILRHCTDVDNTSDYFRNLICIAWKPLLKPYKE